MTTGFTDVIAKQGMRSTNVEGIRSLRLRAEAGLGKLAKSISSQENEHAAARQWIPNHDRSSMCHLYAPWRVTGH
jgi:hypothetical protein